MSSWSGRRLTAEALTDLLKAKLLVRFVRLGRWRGTLGESVGQGQAFPPVDAEVMRQSLRLARSVMRASERIPGHTKCLPQAMALQWMLARRGIPSLLVVAVFKGRHVEGLDEYHAWVEMGGAMVIGQCDQTQYQPLMRLAQGVAAGGSKPEAG